MAWNEPGGSNDDKDKNQDQGNKDRDPWRGDNKGSGNGNGGGSPPDLDRLLRMIQGKIKASLQKSGGTGSDQQPPAMSKKGWTVTIIGALILLAIIWVLAGIFIVSPAQRAVLMTFGKYTSTVGPGPHWIPPFIQTKDVVDVQRIDTYSYESQMLTRDENIVSVAVAVQYRISDPREYLFNVVNPVESLKQATASALRQVIGNSTLDQILTTGREQVRDQVYQQLTQILNSYQAGVMVTDVALQPAKAPDEVKEAFDDAIKAQEDEQRYINQAQAYAMGVEPIAQGQAARILAAASAYQKQVVLKSQADVANYLALLPVYGESPAVTRERMYMDMMQDVLTKSNKVVVDNTGNNMMYLPLGELLQKQGMAIPASASTAVSTASSAAATTLNNTASVNNSNSSVDSMTSSGSSSGRPTRTDYPNISSRDAFTRGAQ